MLNSPDSVVGHVGIGTSGRTCFRGYQKVRNHFLV
jgi:hypothetical protein